MAQIPEARKRWVFRTPAESGSKHSRAGDSI